MAQKQYSPYKGYLVFLIPGFILFLALIIFPFLANFAISFTRWTGVRTPIWIGLTNYQKAIGDKIFWISFKNNLYLILTMVTIPTGIGLFIAAFLFDYIEKKFGNAVVSFFRAGFYIPQIIPVVIAGVIWRWVLQPDWGVLNWVLKSVGLNFMAHNWLGDSEHGPAFGHRHDDLVPDRLSVGDLHGRFAKGRPGIIRGGLHRWGHLVPKVLLYLDPTHST